jgi:hypothetical protein
MDTSTPPPISKASRARARGRAVALLASTLLGAAALVPSVAAAGYAIGG